MPGMKTYLAALSDGERLRKIGMLRGPKPFNAVRCLRCQDVIQSLHVHDFKWCRCGNVAVDGGRDYKRRCFRTEEYEEIT